MKTVSVIGIALLLAGTAVAGTTTFQPLRITRELDFGQGPLVTAIVDHFYDGRYLIQRVSERDLDGDGAMDRRVVSDFTYDEQGNLTEFVAASISIADGTIVARSKSTYEYDAHGNRIHEVRENDLNGDGTIERITTTHYEYDADDNLVSWLIESDIGADGTVDSVTNGTRTYDSGGNLLLEIQESGDVVTDRYTYDSRGNAVVVVSEADFEGDGVTDFTSTRTSTFDNRGNPISASTEFEAEGFVYSTTKTTSTYDARGNLVRAVNESDFDVDGVTDRTETLTYTYTRATGPRSK